MTLINPPFDAKSNQSGFTLLEVLITLLIFSVGLLGLAKMQMHTIKYADSAFRRSQAIFLAHDIFERMRANRTLAANGAYSVAFGDPIVGASDCVASTCSTLQMAGYDLKQWKDDLAALLPLGDGAVTPVASGGVGTIFNISVRWNDDRRASVIDYKTFLLQSEI